MASATDVPGKYDVVINGQGYVLLDALTPNIPFRTHRAVYTYSPTFLERTNVSGSYGDNQQSFWLVSSQNDWSGGEGQHFFRIDDAVSKSRYWRGENIDVSAEGQARLFGAASSVSYPASVGAASAGISEDALTVSTTNLYEEGVDLGAHGATISAVDKAAIAVDGSNIFISGDSGKIRKYVSTTFSDFSSTVAQSMCFVDNTLWGSFNSTLSYYDTAGTATTAFTWKTADGNNLAYGGGLRIKSFGGQVVVLRPGTKIAPAELWLADATGAKQVAAFPKTFVANEMAVVNGIVFVVGYAKKRNYGYRCEVWYYAGGTIGRVYASSLYQSITGNSAICEYGSGFAFVDGPNAQVLAYDLTSGAVSTIVANSSFPNPVGARYCLAPGSDGLFLTVDTATALTFPTTGVANSGKLISSQYDFDSTLTKTFRGITVDWVAATDGDGGSVDIAYKLNATDIGPLDLTYTTLQTGATSGTEYTLTNKTGSSISVQLTLNKGTSTNGPTVKRVYVRAAPQLQTFRKREYIIDLTGGAPDAPRLLRDGTPDATIPHDGITNLVTAAASLSPISITDRLGTFTGIVEPDGFEIYEMHAQAQTPSKSGSFVVRIPVREV